MIFLEWGSLIQAENHIVHRSGVLLGSIMREKENETITSLLNRWGQGDAAALEQLVPLVKEELQKIAKKKVKSDSPNPGMRTTTLLQEAYTSLLKKQKIEFKDRKHFFRFAAILMRHILVDEARRKAPIKVALTLEDQPIHLSPTPETIILLDKRLTELKTVDALAAQVVEMKYFAGFTIKETAEILEIPVIKVNRKWNIAKVWLFEHLKGITS